MFDPLMQAPSKDTHERFSELRLFKTMKVDIVAPEEGTVDVMFTLEERAAANMCSISRFRVREPSPWRNSHLKP